MGNIVIDFWVFVIIIMIALVSGLIAASILRAGSDADDQINSFYWSQVAMMARSIMTQDQLDKLDKMMEKKRELGEEDENNS